MRSYKSFTWPFWVRTFDLSGNVETPRGVLSSLWVPETRIRVVIRSRTALGDGCQDSREIASSSRRQLLFAQTRGRA
jgi:hypothetical protein